MNTLDQLLSSRIRAGLFRVLFGLREAELHVRELGRQCGFHEATTRQELGKLKRLDLVSERRDGNRAYYRANSAHPLYPEIHRLVLKTCGLVELVGDALKGANVRVAFVFGSVARGEENARSDVDLMVVGSVGLRTLSSMLSGLAEKVGREINPHAMTESEYRKRLKGKDHFVTHVLAGPKLFVVGTEDDFESMEKQRLAKS
jgi:predicted nucleotidyltransferase